MVKVVGVRFRKPGKIYFFNPGDLDVRNGDEVIVETALGQEYGTVTVNSRNLPDDTVVKDLKNIIRRSIPTALTVIMGILIISILHTKGKINDEIYPSLCVIATAFSAMLLLITMTKARKSEHKKLPFSCFRVLVCVVVVVLFILGATMLGWWFNIVPFAMMKKEIFYILGLMVINFVIFNLLFTAITKIKEKRTTKAMLK